MKLNLAFGVLLGLFSSGLVYLLYHFGWLRTPEGTRLLLLNPLFHSLLVIVALIRHRAAAMPDNVPFARLFGAGLLISFVGGALSAFGAWIFTSYVDPTHLEWVKEQTARHILESGRPAAEIEAQLGQLAGQATPGAYAAQSLFAVLVIGFLLSLVVSALLRLRGIATRPRDVAA
jgi:hypothetical protein